MKRKILVLTVMLIGSLLGTLTYQRAHAEVPLYYNLLVCTVKDADTGEIEGIGNTCQAGESPECRENPCQGDNS